MELRDYKKGEIIFQEGSYGSEFYEVCAGEVLIYAKYRKPGEKLLATLGVERYFGEMGVIEDRVRSATAVAGDECTLGIVTADKFVDYIRERPTKVLEIMSSMSLRLRELSDDYMTACRTISALNSGEKEKGKLDWLKDSVKKFAKLYDESLVACYCDQSDGIRPYWMYPMHF